MNYSLNLNKIAFWAILLFSFSINISEAGVNIAIVLLTIITILKLFLDRSEFVKIYQSSKPILNSMFIFFGLIIISIIFSDYNSHGINYLDKILRYLIIYFSVIITIKKKEQIDKIFITLSLSILISSVYSFYQYFNLNIYRASGFLSPLTNESALIMVLSIMIILIYRNNNKKRYYFILISLISSFSLIFSNTRGAWLGLIIGLILLSLFFDKRIIFYLFITMIILLLIFPSFQHRFSSIFDISGSSNNERVLMWKSAVEMWKDSPIIGHGVGSFQELYPKKYVLKAARTKSRRFAHSNIFTLLAETGFLGLLTYLYLNIAIFKYGFMKIINFNLNKKQKILIYGYFLSFITFFIHGLTFTNFFISHSANIFWFILAIYISDIEINIYNKMG